MRETSQAPLCAVPIRPTDSSAMGKFHTAVSETHPPRIATRTARRHRCGTGMVRHQLREENLMERPHAMKTVALVSVTAAATAVLMQACGGGGVAMAAD